MKRLILAGALLMGGRTHARALALRAEAGKLTLKRGTAWSDSRVLRLVSDEERSGSTAARMKLFVAALNAPTPEEERPWDGVHLRLRYTSETSYYEAALARRDGGVSLKKVVTGPEGPLPYTLGFAPRPLTTGEWQDLRVSITDEADGRVRLAVHAGGELVLEAWDDGSQGGAPLTAPGRVALRGDNAELSLVDFAVESLPEGAAAPVAKSSVTVRGSEALATWRTSDESESVVEYGPTADYGMRAVGSFGREHAVSLPGVEPGATYHYRVVSRGARGVSAGPDAVFTAVSETDTTPPTPVFLTPGEGASLAVATVVTAAASDDRGVAGLQFFLDGESLGPEQPSQPHSVVLDPARFYPGDHTLTAVARDAAGNRNTASVRVTLAAATNPSSQTDFSAPQAAAYPSAAAAVGAPAPPAEGAGVAAAALGAAAAAADPARAPQRFLSPALADGVNDLARFGAEAAEVSVFDLRGRRVFHALRRGGSALSWNCRDAAGRVVESGVYIARIVTSDGRSVFQSLAVAK